MLPRKVIQRDAWRSWSSTKLWRDAVSPTPDRTTLSLTKPSPLSRASGKLGGVMGQDLRVLGQHRREELLELALNKVKSDIPVDFSIYQSENPGAVISHIHTL